MNEIVTIDFETFYCTKSGYTLKKMTTEEYINDPRFCVTGMSVKVGDAEAYWVRRGNVKSELTGLNINKRRVLCHNTAFDGAILSWKYGVKPLLWLDTMSMARAMFGTVQSVSLATLAELFKLPAKGDAIINLDGLLDEAEREAKGEAEYAIHDAWLTWQIFKLLSPHFPKPEYITIDTTIRMFTEPSFVIDPTKVERELELVAERERNMLAAASCTLADLRSDAKFAQLLESLGIDPPTKVSAKKSAKAGHEVRTWAFAKSDPDFKDLLKHDNELVVAACEARLGLKSTIKESRAGRFMGIHDRMGVMPIPLTYAGAATGRYAASRGDKVNCQNLPADRGNKTDDAALLRKSLAAPAGHAVIAVDASQIEARIVAWLAGEREILSAFEQGQDVYCLMASKLYGKEVTKADVMQRFIGKSVTLGAGYGMSFFTFGRNMAIGFLGSPPTLFDDAVADELGVSLDNFDRFIVDKPELIEKLAGLKPSAVSADAWSVHMACSLKIISEYRKRNANIKALWGKADGLIGDMYAGNKVQLGPITTARNKLWLPNGLPIHYKELKLHDDGKYTYKRRKEGRIMTVGTYGGSVVENVCQGLAGAIVKDAMISMRKVGIRPILQVHDEVVAIAPIGEAEDIKNEMVRCMTTRPSWALDLPLAAEGGIGSNYGEAK